MPPHQTKISNPIDDTEFVSTDSDSLQRLKFAQMILDSLNQFSGLLDESGTVLQINLKSLEAAGVSQSQVEGFPFWETIWWQDSPEAKQQLQEAITRAARGEFVRYETRISNGPETKPVSIELSLTPLQDESGNVAFLCFEGRMVFQQGLMPETDRREMDTALAQQRRLYEAILTNTPDLAYVFDPQHRFIYINEGLLKMWGKSWNEAIGKTCLELGYEPWHAAMHDREIDQVIATREPIRGEVPFTGTFGRRIYDYIFVPVFGPDGSVEAVAGTTRDVTDRKEADRRKDEFLATLAHELRNPLAPIRSSIHILSMTSHGNPNTERVCAMMERQVDLMVRLVDDLMEVSRITRGTIELRKAQTTLATIVRSAVDTSQPIITAQEHQLEISIPSETIPILGDAARLSQVISNLLNNAAKYTDRGGKIWLTGARTADGIVISVRDNGIGIPDESLSLVFDMFMQVERSSSRGQGGLGIGLTLVKQLVEMHGGRVSVHSDGPGRGSEFTITLPSPQSQTSSKLPAASKSAASPLKQRVLVVDDNQDAATSLAMLLRMMGAEVEVANDGPAALAQMSQHHSEIVFLDLGMPEMDGLEVARRARSTPGLENVVLIALTGWGQDDDRQRTRDAGFNHHLVKPVSFSDLQAILATVSESR